MIRYFLGDTETTGTGDDARVCEIAWVELDNELNVLDTVHSLIDPQIPIPANASGVHNITDTDVQSSPTMSEFVEVVLGQPVMEPSILGAHNVKFDARFFGHVLPNQAGTICTLRLARLLWPESPDHKLTTLRYFLGLKSGASHRADGDVETTLDLLRKIANKLEMTLSELVPLSAQPLFIEKMPFGKHFNEPIRNVPRSYFQWLLRQKDPIDSDLKHTIDIVMAGG